MLKYVLSQLINWLNTCGLVKLGETHVITKVTAEIVAFGLCVGFYFAHKVQLSEALSLSGCGSGLS